MADIISVERREQILKKMLSLGDKSIASLAKEEGISKTTLYSWRNRYLTKSEFNKMSNNKLSSETKFMAVVETATLSESEKNEYCRKKGIYPEHLSEWRQVCMQANSSSIKQKQPNIAEFNNLKKQIKILEKELKYKEKALSETAALLVLRKKLNALWEEGSGEG